jgi:hypothetical protein
MQVAMSGRMRRGSLAAVRHLSPKAGLILLMVVAWRVANLMQPGRTRLDLNAALFSNPSFQIQNGSSYHSRLKGWINVARRGVATKYLSHYIAWQRFLTWFRGSVVSGKFIPMSIGR